MKTKVLIIGALLVGIGAGLLTAASFLRFSRQQSQFQKSLKPKPSQKRVMPGCHFSSMAQMAEIVVLAKVIDISDTQWNQDSGGSVGVERGI